jgi:AraC-like DNA-binding protein
MVETPAESGRHRWSTATVAPQHALAYWVETICHSFLEIDIDTPERDRFRAQLDQIEFGPAKLYVVEAGTQCVRRTPARIAHSHEAYYFLMQLRQGKAHFRQAGRDCVIQPGDCVLVDCNQPYALDCLPTTRTVAIRFRQDWLNNWLPSPERFAAQPFRPTAGWSTALSVALANLETAGEEELALPPGVVVEQIAALFALAAGPDAQVSSASGKLLARLKQTIRDRCMEADLCPASVAETNGISRRYLHYLFANAGTTFGSELMRVRLELAQRLLSDRRYLALAVSEVAARCGFVEPSHFARRFRKAFGVGPREFRAQHHS